MKNKNEQKQKQRFVLQWNLTLFSIKLQYQDDRKNKTKEQVEHENLIKQAFDTSCFEICKLCNTRKSYAQEVCKTCSKKFFTSALKNKLPFLTTAILFKKELKKELEYIRSVENENQPIRLKYDWQKKIRKGKTPYTIKSLSVATTNNFSKIALRKYYFYKIDKRTAKYSSLRENFSHETLDGFLKIKTLEVWSESSSSKDFFYSFNHAKVIAHNLMNDSKKIITIREI